jgi:hypothetical protein
VSGIEPVVIEPFAAAKEIEGAVLAAWSLGHTAEFAVWYIVDFAPVGSELEAVENRRAGRAEAQHEATELASAGVAAQHTVGV